MNPPRNKGKRCIKINAITQADLIKRLLEGIHSCQALAELTGLHYVTVLQYTRELHRAGAAHISSWEKDVRGRDSVKIYKLGVGRDAKREKLTSADRQVRARARKKAHDLTKVMAGTARFVQSGNGRLRVEAA
jgi:hypothetical protein